VHECFITDTCLNKHAYTCLNKHAYTCLNKHAYTCQAGVLIQDSSHDDNPSAKMMSVSQSELLLGWRQGKRSED